MNHINLKIVILCALLVGCVPFQPISLYDVYPDKDDKAKQRVFFDDSRGELWSNLKTCGTLEIENLEGNNVVSLDWNKTDCDWVGFGNSWSNFMADDISGIIETHAISFKVMAVDSDQKSVPFVVGMEDYSGGSSYYFSHLNLFGDDLIVSNQKWTTFYMPFTFYDFSVQGVDPFGIKQMIIQLEGSGKLYLDDIKVVPFSKDQYAAMLENVELLNPKGNPNQNIFPGNFEDMAWGTGQTNCQKLMSENEVINWQWNNCSEWKKWGINWNNWYAFSLRGIVEKTNLQLSVSKNHSVFDISLEDFKGKRETISVADYQAKDRNDSIVTYTIPLSEFKLIEKDFALDQMKQFEFFGQESGFASIYEIKLIEQ
ncbi:MAG: hypothetical protein QNK68_05195 [Flavobacteriales bacterium]|jgi:hypothetical protein|tara:strand:- start:31514 stop:32623 length:1110 start_codon:yes stop_codon:yes gene_type:complete